MALERHRLVSTSGTVFSVLTGEYGVSEQRIGGAERRFLHWLVPRPAAAQLDRLGKTGEGEGRLDRELQVRLDLLEWRWLLGEGELAGLQGRGGQRLEVDRG